MGRYDVLDVHHVFFFDLDDAEAVFFEFGDINQSEFVGFFFGILNDERGQVSVEGDFVAPFEFVVAFLVGDEVDEVMVDETAAFNFDFGLYFDTFALVLKIVASDGVSGPEPVALFRAKLVNFLGNQFPETFKIKVMFWRLFEVVFLSRKRR